MKTYRVTFLAMTERHYEVEAKDFNEAKDLASTILEVDDEVSDAWKSDARVVDIEKREKN